MTTTLCAASSPGDNPRDANTAFNQVMQATTVLTCALDAIARRYDDAAPASAEYVRDLQAILATEVLAWIWRWPS